MTLPDGDFRISDYRKLALKAKRELRRDPRQAVEKSYLAAVHAARQIVACSGEKRDDRKKASSWAIGRANEIVGKKLGQRLSKADRERVTRALSSALGQHSACFYDGVCSEGAARDTVKSVIGATKSVERVCRALLEKP